ncbi:hypothetical protein HNR42_001882 [Deinobacterium chartae]|uniref:Peptidase MA superfamily protein n=1 Tax=Deinobacterium chartae TaxID=521158 RepID=A0A841I280_9DEIO|nr:hypothetical protein [Deinobacterium chartae]MBB6098448.1 hypothetical protein [Deinobacterium chartae]
MKRLILTAALSALLGSVVLPDRAAAQSAPAPLSIPVNLEGPLFELRTEHFTVLAPAHARSAAERVLRAAERTRDAVARLVGHAPPHTYLLVDNETDAFNGFAVPGPDPSVRIFASFPLPYQIGQNWPDLDDSLVSHELAHVAHLTEQNGFQRWVRSLIGRVPLPGFTGARMTPAWLLEGLGVWVESQAETGVLGRVQDPYTRLIRERAALEGHFPSLEEVSIGPFEPFPYGSARYVYGGGFVDYLARRYGSEVIARLLRVYNDAPVIEPFETSWRRMTGHDLEADWAAFRAEETVRARAAAPAPHSVADTRGSYLAPAFDGRRLAWWGGARLQVGVWDGRQLTQRRSFALERRPASVAWQGERLLYTRLRPGVQGAVYDVYTLEGGRERRLTDRARARLVAATRDAAWYVRDDGDTSGIYTLGGQEVWRAPEGAHILSLDAREGALLSTLWLPGGQHALLLHLPGRTLRLEAPDDVLEARFTPQGELTYTSARTGVPLSYRWGETEPLATVGGGEFGARAAGGWRASLNLRGDGFAPVIVPHSARPVPLRGRDWDPPAREAALPPAEWRPYRPSPQPWGLAPISPAGVGLSFYGGDPAQLRNYALSAYVAGEGLNASFSVRERLGRGRDLTVYAAGYGRGLPRYGYLGARLDLLLDTPLEVPLEVTPSLRWDGRHLYPGLRVGLDDLGRDDWGYVVGGWSLFVSAGTRGIGWEGVGSARGFTLGLASGPAGTSAELNYLRSFPVGLRYGDGLLSLERVSLVPALGVRPTGDAYASLAVSLDGMANYLQPIRAGARLELRGSGFGVNLFSSIPLPAASDLRQP